MPSRSISNPSKLGSWLMVFRGAVDHETIRAVVESVSVPVVGNGDVSDGPSYHHMRDATGCAAVMVGRAALGNPWVFAELAAAARGEPAPPPPTPADRLAVMRRHLALYTGDYPEPIAAREIRKHLIWYCKGLPNAVEFRRRLQTVTNAAQVNAAIDALEDPLVCDAVEAQCYGGVDAP